MIDIKIKKAVMSDLPAILDLYNQLDVDNGRMLDLSSAEIIFKRINKQLETGEKIITIPSNFVARGQRVVSCVNKPSIEKNTVVRCVVNKQPLFAIKRDIPSSTQIFLKLFPLPIGIIFDFCLLLR